MKKSTMLLWLWCAIPLLPLSAFSARTLSDEATTKATSHKNAESKYSSDGERVFKQNCSRCHNAPQSFPPQISGTVIRHMRVRASLSQTDEQKLLKFLNP